MKNYKLVKAREEAGFTQEKFAEQLGISCSTYVDKENGKRKFWVDEVNLILSILHLSYEDIFLD